MNDEYLKGVRLETKKGQYGEYIKGSIDIETLKQNPINNGKYINFVIFKSKAGNWYAKQSGNQQSENKPIVEFKEVPQEELPF